MPRASYFKDKDISIAWIASKAKKGDTTSAREYKEYSKSRTTKEMYAKGGGRHFTNDMERGIFEFKNSPFRELQQDEMRKLIDERKAKKTRIRNFFTSAESTFLSHGGEDDPANDFLPTDSLYCMLNQLPAPVSYTHLTLPTICSV